MNVSQAADAAVRAALQRSEGPSARDQDLLAGLTGDDLVRARAHLALQKQQETVAFITKVMKNDPAMQTINNLR